MYEELKKRILRKIDPDRSSLTVSEERFVAKWKEVFRLKDDIIIEAFTRALNSKGRDISFSYVDAILRKWADRGVKSYSDVLALDEEFRKKKGFDKGVEKPKYTETIKIKYHTDKIDKLKYIDGKSDWIDLRAAEDVVLEEGDFYMIDLGISVKLPKGYEMLIAPRSSTYKNFGIIQTNSLGCVDETYSSNEDHIKMPVLAMRHTEIHINDRICQFRIIKHQPTIIFDEVDDLGDNVRGGFGSTGIN